MAHTGIVLLLTIGVSAHTVPHWVRRRQTGSELNIPSVAKILAPALSMQSKLAPQTPNSRRLQAIMSEECAAACPGVQDMLKGMMEMATAETTPAPEGVDPGVAAMMAMCDYADAIVCAATESACKDEGAPESEDDPGMMKCLCSCPDVALASDPKKMCAKKDAIVKCMTDTAECSSLVKSMGGAENADITCKMEDLGCSDLGEKMMECVGEETLMLFAGDCGQAVEDEKLADMKDKCCPALTKVMGCYSKECVHLGWKSEQLSGSDGVSKQYAWGKVCTDSGLAASQSDLDAAVNPASSGGSTADAADSAYAAQALSVLTMISAMVAFIA